MRTKTTVTCLMLTLAACGSDRISGASHSGGEPASITLAVSSTDPMTSRGDTRLVTAVVTDANERIIAAPPLSWQSSAPEVATVTGSGERATVTAVEDGTAVISAAFGDAGGVFTVTVHRRLASFVLSVPAAVVAAGFTTQLAAIGRDARGHEISGLRGVSFTTSNPYTVIVAENGLVTALFSSVRPYSADITATVTRDGVTLSDIRHIDVQDPAPARFDFSAFLDPGGLRPEPSFGLAEAGVYFVRDAARIDYTIAWSYLSGPPTSAHVHGPAGDDEVGAVLVDLPLGPGAGIHGYATGSFSAADIRPRDGEPAIGIDSLVTLMNTFEAYVDMHTATAPGGEVRGLIYPFGCCGISTKGALARSIERRATTRPVTHLARARRPSARAGE